MGTSRTGGLIARAGRGARIGWQRSGPILAALAGLCAAGAAGCTSDAPETISVALSPASVTLAPGATQQFTATVTGTQRTAVTWTVEPVSCGSVSTAGLYTAPSAEGTCTVRATSQADGSKSATAAVTVVKNTPVAPVIASFTATPATIAAGATSTLAWSVTGADSLAIDQGVGAVTGSSKVVQPASTTTYTLSATNAAGTTTRTVTVTVTAPAPVITAFTATPATITLGQSSALAWTVTGATTLSINQGVGAVTGTTSKTVQPTATTTYTLTATNATGTVTAQVTVTLSAPSITTSTATPPSITAGQSSTLAWAVTGAATLSIDKGVGVVTGTSKSVSPTATTTYTLTATNASGSVTAQASVTITAVGAPSIASFTATPPSITAGQSSTLAWSVTGATTVSIDQGVGTVGSASSTTVSPTATTVYTLTATGAGGTATGQVAVSVSSATPVISTFTATPANITSGQSSTLAWATTGATALSIDQGVGVVTGTTSKTVQPAADTTYTLTASNGGATVTKQVTVTVGAAVAPAITSFTASPASIKSGASTTLSWTVTGATSLSLDQGVGTVTGTSKVLSPTASTTWLLTATSGAGSVTMPVTVTVHPTAPNAVIHEFAVDVAGMDAAPATSAANVGRFQQTAVPQGQSVTLRWTVANATGGKIAIDNGVGTANAVATATVTPPSTGAGPCPGRPAATTCTTYTLTAQPGGATAKVVVEAITAAPVTPVDPGTADVTVTVDATKSVHPISSLVYGYNADTLSGAPPGTTLLRVGGNRWTAWNWETGASNAGSDYNYQSDNHLTSSSQPGAAIKPTLDNCQTGAGTTASSGCATLVTVPMQGWVAADENGPASLTDPVSKRFFPISSRKGSAFSATPNTTDKLVYADELAKWIDTNYPLAKSDPLRPVHFSLDNEPDLWCGNLSGATCTGTHPEVQRVALTYADLIAKTINHSAALKDVSPAGLVYGPVSYGWVGFINLQQAPDSGTGDFLDTFMSQLKTTSESQGRRLLDVLDLHFYSEATGGGTRVIVQNNTAAVAAARVQAPRSLWDSSYKENSWITTCCQYLGQQGIDLVPVMINKIAAKNPGTKLGLTEYNHGGGDHISGAIAQADTLGIFGRTGVYAATYWALINSDIYTYGAFKLYRSYDGAGARFGDTSVSALSSDLSKVSAHAAVDSANPGRVTTVLINRDTASHTVKVLWNGLGCTVTTSALWQIAEPVLKASDGSVTPKSGAAPALVTNSTLVTLPASSASLVAVACP
jgi:hypothetical protein